MSTKFLELGQGHLIPELGSFYREQLFEVVEQLASYTPEFAQMQKKSWLEKDLKVSFERLDEQPIRGLGDRVPLDRLAVVILAGGAGSRLGSSLPKGCFPLLGKSLFERLCEKILPDVPVAILTSPLNHAQTVAFFQKHQQFGLRRLSFFSQGVLPLLDEKGLWFWERPGKIACGADGNASVFEALERSGLAEQFAKSGVEKIQIVPVDNPLADPLDAPMQGEADLILKCIRMEDPNEPMGRLVKINGKLGIVEFSELSSEDKTQNLFANTGLLTIDLALVRQLAEKNFPLHWAWRGAWKAERFIVDALLFAKRPLAIRVKRDDCFAPLKEKNSITQIERLLMERERPVVL